MAEAFAEMRRDLVTLDTQMRTMLGDATKTIESRLRVAVEAVEEARDTGTAAVEDALTALVSREDQVLEVLRQVARSYELLGEHMTAEKLERRSLVESLGGAVRAVSGAVQRPRLIGGSIFGTGSDTDGSLLASEGPVAADGSLDLTAWTEIVPSHPPRVEVRCRFGDRWVDGFEVADIVDDGESFQYKLRRKSDGEVLPTLFDARNVRRASDPLPAEATPARPWWRS